MKTFFIIIRGPLGIGKTTIAKEVNTIAVKEWEGMGIIKNVSGTTSLVSAITMTSTVGDASLSTGNVTIAADNANDRLAVTVVGIAALDINWITIIKYVKVI
mgnify:CR=1 FL=1